MAEKKLTRQLETPMDLSNIKIKKINKLYHLKRDRLRFSKFF